MTMLPIVITLIAVIMFFKMLHDVATDGRFDGGDFSHSICSTLRHFVQFFAFFVGMWNQPTTTMTTLFLCISWYSYLEMKNSRFLPDWLSLDAIWSPDVRPKRSFDDTRIPWQFFVFFVGMWHQKLITTLFFAMYLYYVIYWEFKFRKMAANRLMWRSLLHYHHMVPFYSKDDWVPPHVRGFFGWVPPNIRELFGQVSLYIRGFFGWVLPHIGGVICQVSRHVLQLFGIRCGDDSTTKTGKSKEPARNSTTQPQFVVPPPTKTHMPVAKDPPPIFLPSRRVKILPATKAANSRCRSVRFAKTPVRVVTPTPERPSPDSVPSRKSRLVKTAAASQGSGKNEKPQSVASPGTVITPTKPSTPKGVPSRQRKIRRAKTNREESFARTSGQKRGLAEDPLLEPDCPTTSPKKSRRLFSPLASMSDSEVEEHSRELERVMIQRHLEADLDMVEDEKEHMMMMRTLEARFGEVLAHVLVHLYLPPGINSNEWTQTPLVQRNYRPDPDDIEKTFRAISAEELLEVLKMRLSLL